MGQTVSDVHDAIEDMIIRGSDELLDLLRQGLPLRPGRVGGEAQRTWGLIAEMAQREGILTEEEATRFLGEIQKNPPEERWIAA